MVPCEWIPSAFPRECGRGCCPRPWGEQGTARSLAGTCQGSEPDGYHDGAASRKTTLTFRSVCLGSCKSR